MASRGDAKWTALPALQSIWPRWNPACIGHSLWVSTNYDDGERGMAEFRCTSNTMKRPNPYPVSSNSKQTFQPRYHSICGSHQNGIVLVDGDEGKVISFDPKTKKYGVPVSIPKLGAYASSLMIQGNVHIFHGHSNDQNQYLVHSMKSGRVSKFECNLSSPPMAYVSITKRSDDLEFYKFGGVNWNTKQYFDSFYVGTLPDGDPKKPIVWEEKVQFRLRQPLGGCGVIQRGPFIVTFGGQTTGYKWLDDIYILDVRRSNEGWVQSPIKCPMKSKYIAVLDHQQTVHIFTKGKQDKQHYSIPLRDIIPVLVMPPLAPRRSSKRGRKEQRGKDGDKRGRDGKRVKRDDAKLKEINATLRAMVESLQDELERVKRDNGMYQQVRRALERTNLEMRSLNSSLNAENERLMEQLVIYQDEQKEAQMRIAELEGKVKELELRSLDVSEFLIWDWKQIHFWIMAVDKGRFQKYEAVLRDALEETEMVGEDLLSVNPLVLKMWGINDRKDRERMNGHIQDLLQQQRVHGGTTPSARTPSARSPFARSPMSEGDPTTFV